MEPPAVIGPPGSDTVLLAQARYVFETLGDQSGTSEEERTDELSILRRRKE
jgi:hypothetical protein